MLGAGRIAAVLATASDMSDPSAIGRLTRRLNWIGAALLAAALVAFVWAVGFTRGVDGLIDGLILSGGGLFVPGMAMLWVAWIIGSAGADEAVIAVPPDPDARRSRRLTRVRDYCVAAIAVGVAAIVRDSLTPFVGDTSPFATFFLAVAVAAWVGGMGPAALAAALSVPIVWKLFLELPLPSPGPTSELVGLGMFLAVALSIAGITSALRLTQSRAAALRTDVSGRQAECDESEARFRELANRLPEMIWMADAGRQCTFFNKAWYVFTGRAMEDELGHGWSDGIHPDDRERCLAVITTSFAEREPYSMHYRLRRHDGTYRRVADHGRPRMLSDGRFAGFIGECADVTEPRESPLEPIEALPTTASGEHNDHPQERI